MLRSQTFKKQVQQPRLEDLHSTLPSTKSSSLLISFSGHRNKNTIVMAIYKLQPIGSKLIDIETWQLYSFFHLSITVFIPKCSPMPDPPSVSDPH